MPTPLSPEPISELDPGQLPPYLSNGVIGIRFASLPHLVGTTMVSGFAGISPDDGVEGFARAPYVLAVDVALDDVWASTAPEWVEFVEQRYDFEAAELQTRWRFRCGDATATVETTAFCPRSVPGLAAVEVSVAVDGPADLRLSAGLDPPGVPGSGDRHAQPQDQGPNEGVDGRLRWHSGGDLATLGLAYATTLTGDADAERTTTTRTIVAGFRRPTPFGHGEIAPIA